MRACVALLVVLAAGCSLIAGLPSDYRLDGPASGSDASDDAHDARDGDDASGEGG